MEEEQGPLGAADSAGQQTDSAGQQTDSAGQQTDSAGQQTDSAGHPSEQAWWAREGYASLQDALDDIDAGWDRIGMSSWRHRRPKTEELPAGNPPGVDAETLHRDATRVGVRRNRQVCVRLTDLGYEALDKAARRYGVRPSTLARMLIHRGAAAMLEGIAD